MSFLICSNLLLKNWQNVSCRSLEGVLVGSEVFPTMRASRYVQSPHGCFLLLLFLNLTSPKRFPIA